MLVLFGKLCRQNGVLFGKLHLFVGCCGFSAKGLQRKTGFFEAKIIDAIRCDTASVIFSFVKGSFSCICSFVYVYLGGGYFHPYLGKISNLANIFQLG